MALMASSDSARILGLHWGRTQWRPGYRVASPAIRAMGTLPVRCRSGSGNVTRCAGMDCRARGRAKSHA